MLKRRGKEFSSGMVEVLTSFLEPLRAVFLAAFALLTLVCSDVLADAGIAPPSENMHRATNNIVAALVLDIDPQGTFLVAKQFDLFGENPAPKKFSLRAPSWVVAQLSKGTTYVIAYTAYSANPMMSESVVLDPNGPMVLVDPGMEPAIFKDSADTRLLLADQPRTSEITSRAYLERVLAGLSDSDPQIQNYFSAELACRAALLKKLSASDVLPVKQLLDNPDAHPSARAQLLEVAANLPTFFDDAWLEKYTSQLLGSLAVSGHTTAGDLSAALAQSAFVVVEQRKLEIALPKLVRWIPSDAPGLAEFALLAIRRQAPAQEKTLVAQTLERSLLNNATLEFLVDHLRRLEIMNAALINH
jgi:hypothetical protein